MSTRDQADEKDRIVSPILTMNGWHDFRRVFLNLVGNLEDAKTYLLTGVLPIHRPPLFDDLLRDEDNSLYVPSPQDLEAEPIGVHRRYPQNSVGEVMWREEFKSTRYARERQKKDCAYMWILLFKSMDKTVNTKVMNNRHYRHAEDTGDIYILWEIMRKESSNQYAALSASDLLGQLTNLSQKGSTFDQYARSFRDIVDQLSRTSECPSPLMLVQMFIRGLNPEDQVNIAWKERYINTRAAEQPATYDDIIEDIRSYTLQRITFGVSSVPNQKGSTKDGNVQAYAAGAGQPNNGSVGKGQHKNGRNEPDTNPSKPKESAGTAVL